MIVRLEPFHRDIDGTLKTTLFPVD